MHTDTKDLCILLKNDHKIYLQIKTMPDETKNTQSTN